MDGNLSELELLQLAKAELLNRSTKKYGEWIKTITDNGSINYKRLCMDTGEYEFISTSVADIDIEKTIKKQNKGKELTEYFCNSTSEELTNENILFFFANTTTYQSYLDIGKITDKIISINKDYQIHNDYEENLIYNAVLSLIKIGEIPEELFEKINDYLPPLGGEVNISRKAA